MRVLNSRLQSSPGTLLMSATLLLTAACGGGGGKAGAGAAVSPTPRNYGAETTAESCADKSAAGCRRECEGGSAHACVWLALMYGTGRGAPKDPMMAQQFALRACEGGEGDGCRLAGLGLETGMVADADLPRAMAYYQRGCELGDKLSCRFVQSGGAEAADGGGGAEPGPGPATGAGRAPVATGAGLPDGSALFDPSTLVSTRWSSDGSLLVIMLRGRSPDWSAFRDQVRQAYLRLQRLAPGKHLAVRYQDNGRMALSDIDPDTKRVSILAGNRVTTLDDPTNYAVAATPGATLVSEKYVDTVKFAVCTGEVQNLGSAPVTISVRYQIITRGEARSIGNILRAGGPIVGGKTGPAEMVTEVLADQVEDLGTVKPGKSQRYKFRISTLANPIKGPRSFSGGPLKDSLTFQASFIVNGKPERHLHLGVNTEAQAWLELLEGFFADGVDQVRPPDNLKYTLHLRVPDDFAQRPEATQRALAARLWKAISAHFKKYDERNPEQLRLVTGNGPVARLLGGKLAPLAP